MIDQPPGKAAAASPVPVVMCFDLEPDDREHPPVPGRTVSWDGVEDTMAIVEGYRDRVSEATGSAAHFSWFLRMDPAIEVLHGDPAWAARRFGSLLEQVRSRGDAIGLHTHAHRWDESVDDWVVEHGDPAWLRHCLATAFAAYQGAFGGFCRINRIGDWFMSNGAMAELETLGVVVDLTVEPGQRPIPTNTPDHHHTGRLPDYTRAERDPYRPSRLDFRRPATGDADARRLWELPVLAADLRPRTSLPRRLVRFARYPGRPPFRPWPIWSPIPGDEFWDLIEKDLAGRGRPCLTFAMRSDTPLMPGGRQAIGDKFEALLSRPLVRRLRFATPEEALHHLGIA